MGRLLGLSSLLALAASLLGVMQPPAAAAAVFVPDSWHAASPMHYARGNGMTATALPDGRVLVVGGASAGGHGVSTPEIWDRATGWTLSPMPGPVPHLVNHTATLLADGRVLVAGGFDTIADTAVAQAWLWSPGPTDAGTWALTGSMLTKRSGHAAAAIGADVLVVGGSNAGGATSSAEIYHTATGTFSYAANSGIARANALVGTARWGNILVAGGEKTVCSSTGGCASTPYKTARLYDPVQNTWASAGSMMSPRLEGVVAPLDGGALFFAGGRDSVGGDPVATAEVISPQGSWGRVANMFVARAEATATTMDDFSVVVAGGRTATGLADVEVFDRYTDAFRPGAAMLTNRYGAAAVHLDDENQVLVMGGRNAAGAPIASAELYTPAEPLHTYPGGTYHPVTPKRIVDSRSGLGLSHALPANGSDAFFVTGGGSPVPLNAVAVTGILTVTNATAPGYVTLGTYVSDSPSYSTINFPAGDDRANNVTLAVRPFTPQNLLAIRYVASNASGKVDVIFDVTGYFTPDATGATYHPVTPGRFLDTRYNIGNTTPSPMPWACLQTGKITDTCGRTFRVAGFTASNGTTVPVGATAITGNVTGISPTSKGYLTFQSGTSVLNLAAKDIRANGVTLKLNGQFLTVTWQGGAYSSINVAFDVTGYFTGDATGARFYAIDPVRLLDSRYGNGLFGPLLTKTPRTFPIGSRGGSGFFVPADAKGIAGNLTVVGQTTAGYAFVGPSAPSTPPSSNLNVPKGDIRANGFDSRLSSTGSLGIVWVGETGSSAQGIVDVTGYWK